MNRPFRSANRRLVGAAVVSGLLLVPLGVFGSSALARTASGLGPSAAQYQYGKVTVCHHTGSKKHPWHEITISKNALAAHIRHGDTLGACPATTTARHHGKPTSTTTSTQSSSKSHGHDSDAQANASSTSNGQSGTHGKGDDNGHHGKS